MAGHHRGPGWPDPLDLLAAGLIALLAVPEALARHTGAVGVAFDVAFAVVLLWRSRHPMAVFAALAAIAFAQWLLDVRAVGDAALLVGLYTVASRQNPGRLVLAAVVLQAGIVMAVIRWPGEGAVKALIGLTGLAAAAGVLGLNTRHRRRLLAGLQERAARLEVERDQQGRLAAAAERSRIARELHDVVAHNLTVMVALADGAAYALESSPERAQAALATASRTGREALAEMRRLLGVLRTEDARPAEVAPQPRLADLDRLIEQVRAAGLPVSFRTPADVTDVPAGPQVAVFRIVQEALTNTLKHAGPSATAAVAVERSDGRLEVTVTDTGRASGPIRAGGAGVHGMRERAAVYGGTVEAGPAPGGGWRVHAQLQLACETDALAARPVGADA